METVPYTSGLHQVSDHCFAWLQPDGSWGLSNAGLVANQGESLLVDTQFDLPRTRTMLHSMATVTQRAPITRLVNTHADGDHCFGNQLLPDSVEKIACEAAAAMMNQEHLDGIVSRLASSAPGMDFMRKCFGQFDFSGIEVQKPSTTFNGAMNVHVGDLAVEIMEMQSAHTSGDTVVHVPSEGVLYAGDLLFIDAAPIAWAGPLSSWAEACDILIGLDPQIVVPGHGPITDRAGIERVRDYLLHVESEATDAFHRGQSIVEAAYAIDMSDFADLKEPGRLLQNVQNTYRHLGSDEAPIALMAEMEKYEEHCRSNV